jgi:dienelactone hydrolase
MGTQTAVTLAPFKLEQADGTVLEGEVRVIEGGGRKPALLLGHGFRGHKDWAFWPDIAERFARQGYYAVTFNFARIAAAKSGDARKAAETVTLSRELEDWRTIVRSAVRGELPLAEGADLGRLAVLGHSRAGTSGLLIAGELTEVKAAVVWNGGGAPIRPSAEEGQELTPAQQALIDDLDRNGERFDARRVFASLAIPVLIVQGEADGERLLENFKALRDLAPHQSFVAIPGAAHRFGAADPYAGTTPALDIAVSETAAFLDRVFG